jgi:hypothetical protein
MRAAAIFNCWPLPLTKIAAAIFNCWPLPLTKIAAAHFLIFGRRR